MTGKKLRALLQELSGNTYSETLLAQWLEQCDNEVLMEVLLLPPEECVEYETMPEGDLLVPKPYDKLYLPYMQAMIEHANGEMEAYENYLALYNSYRNEYARYVCEVVRPVYGEAVQRGYYLSAYNLAVVNGYGGTLKEWLASLRGPAGLSAYQEAVALGFEGSREEWIDSLRGAQGGDGYLDVSAQWAEERAAGTQEAELEQWLISGVLGDGAYSIRSDSGYSEFRQETARGVCYQHLRRCAHDGCLTFQSYINGSPVPEISAKAGEIRIDGVGVATEEYVTRQAAEIQRAAVEVFAVTPQMFGAAGDGITDDTAAFKAALAASTSVYVPAGAYIITEALHVRQNGTLYGAGVRSVLICRDDASGGGAIELSAFASARRFAIRVQGGSGDLIRVNEDTLRDATGLKSGDVAINIEDLLITYQDDGNSSTRATISLTLCDSYGDSRRRGYHGVAIRNVHVFGNGTGYFLRCYTEGTEMQNGAEVPKYWITGITVEKCFAAGCRWGIFMHKSDGDYSDLAQTYGIDHISAFRLQHQCDKGTRGFAFLRKETNAQFTNCVPWDWHYAQGDYASRPFWFASDRLEQSSAKVEITGYSVNGTKFGFLYSDGSTRLLGYPDQYLLSKHIGTRDVLLDALPKQMALGDDTIKATCIFRSSDKKIMADDAYLYLHFKFIDSHYMAEDVTVYLHPQEPYIVAGRWNTKHKLGYTVAEDGEFRLYVYSDRQKVYSYVESAPISNNITVYDGSAACTNYHKTVNTFELPYQERYLTEVPENMVEITRVDVTYAPANHTHEYGDLNNLPTIPTSLPANGGDADTVGGRLPSDFAEKDHGHSYNDLADKPTIPTKASDVGARPETWLPTAKDVGAEPNGTAEGKVSGHNTASDAHSDIRLLIAELVNRVNAIADSDDTTLDQLSELVAYIKNNRSLIDGITTGKVSVSDVVDDLTTNVANKPLSAGQGVALKALIDAITVPKKVSELINDSGYLASAPVASVNGKIGAVQLDAKDVGALPSNTYIPTIPDSLPAKGGDADTVGGKQAGDFAEKTHVHSYNDLTDRPSIPAAYTHPASHPASMITGLATVATSGSYSDLKNQPSIPKKATDIGAVPDSNTLTMVGVDADGNTHTWTIYGKAVT